MSALQVPLSAVSGGALPIDLETAGQSLQPEGVSGLPIGPVRIRGTLTGDGVQFVFTGHVAGSFTGTCARCLGPAEMPFDVEAIWVFSQGPLPHPLEDWEEEEVEDEEADSGVTRIPLDGNFIDLALAAWEEIALAMPLKFLCKETCAGLCPECGANLNDTRCGCAAGTNETTFANKGLKALGDLFPDLKPDRSED
ncbi:MAG: DUF177 domain-containing protein [Candidatus Hydrogenedentes bacterium]|nr:DUF177 domain-containing protein [Candidatus Hydrogenedentota bacterium]